MKITMLQMDCKLASPAENFAHAEALIRQAAQDGPDVITLPETFNIGFFPREHLRELCDREGEETIRRFSALAKELQVNLVAGSVGNVRQDGIYNTCYIFDRQGKVLGDYDKTHLFSPMGEDQFFQKGSHLTTFQLDGVLCGIIICYDMRFLELVRSLSLQGIQVLFVVAHWPDARLNHWRILSQARAVENQMFVVATNACSRAGETQYAGHSMMVDPWGEILAEGGPGEERITGTLDFSVIRGIRESINVYRDRRPELYQLDCNHQ